jgi:hypothetical protein
LRYIADHQKDLRVDDYGDLRSKLSKQLDSKKLGKMVILPSSFGLGPRYMFEK